MTNKETNTTPNAAETTSEYVSHNFDAVNRAIDTEVDRRIELSELYRYEGSSRRSLIFMHISASLSFIAVAIALIWWLLNPVNSNAHYADVTTTSPAFDRSTKEALAIISDQEQDGSTEQSFINTSFTVFHRTLTSSGEYVVTGKTYQPDDLKTPEEQYCYLERSESSAGLSGEPLAAINEGDFTLETTEEDLIRFAREYCQFSAAH